MQQNQAVLEINLAHPIIQQLQQKYKSAPDTTDTKGLALLVYDVAALTGGYSIEDAANFAKRVTGLMMKDMNLPVDAEPAAATSTSSAETGAADSSSSSSGSASDDATESVDAEVVG
jgi:Hsp90 protein